MRNYINSPIDALINKLEGIAFIEDAQKNIIDNSKKTGNKIIVVASPSGGNGKTTITLNLAHVLAEKVNSGAIEIMLKSIKVLGYDIVLFDTSSNISEMELSLIECADNVFAISVPDIGNGWKLIQQRELIDSIQCTEKYRLIVNRYSRKSKFSCKQLEMELQYPLIGVIPNNEVIQAEANDGRLISQINNFRLIAYIKYIANHIEPIFSKKEIKINKIR